MDTVLSALAAGTPIVAITGPPGIGRTTALHKAGERLFERGTAVTAIRFTRDGDAIPVRSPGADSSSVPLAPVVGAHRDPEIARLAASAVAADLLPGGRGAALLIDDVQWSDRDSRAVLGALVRGLTGKSITCVCAVRTPIPVGQLPWWRSLRDDNLVSSVRLRPMAECEIVAEIAAATSAEPDDELIGRVRELSRGIPAAVRDSIEMLLHNGTIRVLDGKARCVPPAFPVPSSGDDGVLRRLRVLPPLARTAATAACVFAPLGEEVPRLVAGVLETSEAEAVALLDTLRREGILHRGRNGHSWRVLVPVVASSLTDAMAPFERRQLAATAITAVWTGEARCDDLDYLCDLVVDAGGLIDRALAFPALMERASEAGARSPSRALRWLDAAVDIAQNPAQRVAAMLERIEIRHIRGDHECSHRDAQQLLTSFAGRLAPEVVQRLQALTHCAPDTAGHDEKPRMIS
ncbi:AAA family ATPase [Amycolatopsis sp. NPDC059027]|uniref:ATP-binding protein n=1 Tax=Amycolatopsis sp. NPDC059027 TaxID=3346709 RepID=UPI00366DA125